jgi:hypothetical protein
MGILSMNICELMSTEFPENRNFRKIEISGKKTRIFHVKADAIAKMLQFS